MNTVFALIAGKLFQSMPGVILEARLSRYFAAITLTYMLAKSINLRVAP